MFTKTAKTLLAVLALTSSSVVLTSKADAGPTYQQAPVSNDAWMERASRNIDGNAQ
jgi:hypothetical protein